MSTSVITDSILDISSGPDGLVDQISDPTNDVDFFQCNCCGLTEECTVLYVETIRKRYGGKWICGLCAEAVKDEILRSRQKLISPDEALDRHISFCKKFRASGPPQDPTAHLIRAMRQLLRKSLDSPKSVRSMPCSPLTTSNFGMDDDDETDHGVLTRSESCIPSLSLVEAASVYCGMEEGCEM